MWYYNNKDKKNIIGSINTKNTNVSYNVTKKLDMPDFSDKSKESIINIMTYVYNNLIKYNAPSTVIIYYMTIVKSAIDSGLDDIYFDNFKTGTEMIIDTINIIIDIENDIENGKKIDINDLDINNLLNRE